MPTITDAEAGTEIAADGILGGVVMTTPPSNYSDDYFCLVDVIDGSETVLYNVHISTSAFSSGSVLMENQNIPFKSLVMKSKGMGSVFEITLAAPPVLSSLSPPSAVSGDPDLVLSCMGTGFTKGTTIIFGSNDEPTTFVSDTEVTTGVKPSLFAPAVVPVSVRNGTIKSDPVDFTFTEPAAKEA